MDRSSSRGPPTKVTLVPTAASFARMAAPGGSGPIGPYPPGVETEEQRDAYDRLRRRVLWSLPSGLYVVGSRSGVKRNLMTINWSTVLASIRGREHQRRHLLPHLV